MKIKILVFLICILFVFAVFPMSTTSLNQKRFIERETSFYKPTVYDLPPAWDWRDVNGEDWTTSIRDQLQDKCGSCWAFGALGGLESDYKIWKNDSSLDIDLSEQYILSCSPGSCNGWYLSNTLNWIRHNGVIPEDCMPYEADDTIPCEAKCGNWREQLFGIKSYKKLPRGDVNAIKEALINYGPLPATMEVYSDFYPNWNGGVYQQTSDEFVFGHVITIVGFNDNWGGENEGYWICKNSWGTEWGENGWFRIAYEECKIENSVYYLEGPNYPPEKPEKPNGPSNGKPGVEYTFSSSCVDLDDNKLYYMFDWGDGNNSGWLGPYGSGEIVSANYTWSSKGTYSVKVKTRDFLGPSMYDYGLDSEWSDSLEVTMSKNKVVRTPIVHLLDIHSGFFNTIKQLIYLNQKVIP